MKQGIKNIKVVSWNILAASRAFGTFDGVRNEHLTWDHRLPLVVRQLHDAEFDVAALIEVEQVQFDTLQRALDGFGGIYFPKPVDETPSAGDLASHGIAIFYRIGAVRVDEYGSVRLPPTQQAVFADLVFEGEEMHLVACHLKSKPENNNTRREQAYVLEDHPSLLRKGGRPTLLVGDMNEEMPDDLPERITSIFGKFMWNYGRGLTHWAPAFSTWKSRDGVEVKRAIDHAFCDEYIYLLKTDATPQPNAMLPNANFPSDHVPLVLSIAWTTRSPNGELHPVTYKLGR